MDVADLSFALPAILFTLLAIVLANTIFGKKTTSVPQSEAQSGAPAESDWTADERCERGREADTPALPPPRTIIKGEFEGAEPVGGGQLQEDGAAPAESPPGPQVEDDVGVSTSTRCPGRRQVSGEPDYNTEGSPEIVGEGDCKAVPEAQTAFLKTTNLVHDPIQDVDVISRPIPVNVAPCHLSLERDVFLHHLPDVEIHKTSPDSDSEPALEQVEDDLAALEENLAEYSPENEDDEDTIAVGTEAQDLSLRYALGKLRTSQLEEMMTKEEVEEKEQSPV
ncbi:matrix-remodeling-associated protein 7 isoform X2 [Scleropages formosus]|uniref:matrix-remodeling-associated protein 7 isoform X2 n=1 Tax=Scleropages formosus TaxID=113540 RepID=UPI0010FA9360|nr:uncharacterized protein LOC108940104 isoform X2 [Scleropages formosus]